MEADVENVRERFEDARKAQSEEDEKEGKGKAGMESRKGLCGLPGRKKSCSSYFERHEVSAASFFDPYNDFPENFDELYKEVSSLGWVHVCDGRWSHTDFKENPCQGKVGCRSFEANIQAKNITDFLQKALVVLRDGMK